MRKRVCLLCFSFANVFKDIKYTQLKNVYEELQGNKIQVDSYPLCYVCYAKLLQCQLLIKTVRQHNSENQPPARPLVELTMFDNDNWTLPNNFVKIELQPEVKEEYTKEENVDDDPGSDIEIDIKEECIKKCVENNPGHCADETDLKSVVKKHKSTKRRTTNGIPYFCNVCRKKLSKLRSLKRHQLTHANARPYMCDVCIKTFCESSTLKRHKLKHSDNKPYRCDICTKKFLRLRTLKRHIKVIHTTITPDKLHTCHVCSKKFAVLDYLKKHQLMHAGEKTNGCDVCSKKFRTNSELNRHKLAHSGKAQNRKQHTTYHTHVIFVPSSSLD